MLLTESYNVYDESQFKLFLSSSKEYAWLSEEGNFNILNETIRSKKTIIINEGDKSRLSVLVDKFLDDVKDLKEKNKDEIEGMKNVVVGLFKVAIFITSGVGAVSMAANPAFLGVGILLKVVGATSFLLGIINSYFLGSNMAALLSSNIAKCKIVREKLIKDNMSEELISSYSSLIEKNKSILERNNEFIKKTKF